MEVPEDLLRRIDALQERNEALWKKQDEMLAKALHSGPAGATPSSASRNAGLRRSSSAHASGRARAVSSSRALPAALPQDLQRRPSQPPRDVALAQRLRKFRDLVDRHQQREDALERRLARRVLEPMGHFQRSLEALAESQRCIQEEQHQRIQLLEAEGVRQQQIYQEQALEVQEAMLAQSRRREGELALELQELERECEAVQAADARLRQEAAELGPSGAPQDAPMLSLLDRVGQMSARSASSADAAALAFGPEGLVLAQQPAAAGRWPQLGAEIPRVYQESLAIILEHGWSTLHGGEHAGPAWTVLHWAAADGRAELCELLLRAEADPLHEDEDGQTALDYALARGHHATAALLAGEPVPAALGPCPRVVLEGGSPRDNEWRLDSEEQRV